VKHLHKHLFTKPKKANRNKIAVSKFSFSKLQLVLFVLAFASVGGYILLSSQAAGSTANLWVDTNGGSCTRQSTAGNYVDAQACGSFDAAYHAANPGDLVLVQSGNYGDQSLSADGTKAAGGARVVIAPATGATVVVGSKPLSTTIQTSEGLDVEGANAITFQDFIVRGDVTANAGANNITYQNITTNNGVFGIYGGLNISFIGGGYGNVSRYNGRFYESANGVHNQNIVVDGITVHDITSDDLNCCHVTGLLVADADGIVIKNSKFYNNYVFDLELGVFLDQVLNNVTVENNTFGSGTNGVPFSSSLAENTNTTSWNNLNVRNNTALVAMRHPDCSGGCTNVRYSGNISPLTASYPSACVNSPGITYSHNVWTGGAGTCSASDKAVANAGLVNSNISPPDLHLTSSSPAIDAGDPTNCPATDIDGQARPNGTTCDAGADEYYTADAVPPTVSLTAPSAGATIIGTTTVTATASDNVGVAGVQFKLDGANLGSEDTSSPYSISWNSTLTSNGSHTLTAVARDTGGNTTTSSAVTLNVNNPPDNTAPTVSLSAPAGGSTVQNSVTVSANASDNVGVAGVQFKLDGANLQSEDTSSPYSINWDTTTVANGSHTLTAVARDGAGNTTTSSAVTVTVTNTTLRAAFALDEGSGATAADTSGNSNTLTLNGATWNATGKYGKALSFNGTSGYASTPDSPALDIVSAGTLEAWVKINALNQWHGIIAKANTSSDAARNYAMEITNTNQVACFLGNGSAATPLMTSTTALATGAFYHIACTWDGANLKVYVNGVMERSVAQSLTPAANTDSLMIGQYGGGADFANATIDEIRIYSKALSAAEISSDMSTAITAGASIQGDLNGDGHVTVTDLSIMLSHYGQAATASQGDINGDNTCNILDLSILLSHYGQ
jgi:hypothetical protein